MACNPLTPTPCVEEMLVGGVGGSLGQPPLSEQLREGAQWVIETTVTWWLSPSGLDLETSGVTQLRQIVLYAAVAIAVGGVVWQAIRMMLSRRPDPLLQIGRGLGMMALWGAIGVTAPQLLLQAGDGFSSWVVDQATADQLGDRLGAVVSMTGFPDGAVMILSLLMIAGGIAQAVLMLFREGAVIVLAGIVVLAAAGQFTDLGRAWLPRVLGWMLALIVYKPVAALVYGAAFTLVGDGRDPRSVFVALTMILTSLVALPVLLRLFEWSAGGVGMQGVRLAGATGALSVVDRRGATVVVGPDAATHARELRSSLGPVTGAAGTPRRRHTTPTVATSHPTGESRHDDHGDDETVGTATTTSDERDMTPTGETR